jgi:SpoVK/Ycf46/Vps4 family AAA+-type ATPase
MVKGGKSMNAKLLQRLVQSIAINDTLTLKQLAQTIVDEEKKKGHIKLANQLEDIISSTATRFQNNSVRKNDNVNLGGMSSLPMSRRNNQVLATMIGRDKLKHHMVLSSELERRFDKIEKEYSARERLLKHNLKPRSRVLLYGPPGCGKTLGAERLAWNLGLPLMKVKFDAIISSYFGESSANLRAIFEASSENACVLLLDECDFIAKSRTTGQDVGEVPRIVNMLLMLLDEYNAPGILVATTNLENSLDKALFRRFDEVIEITRPTDKEVFQLFQTTLSTFNVSAKINWDMIVEKVKGFSAANIVQVAENAAKSTILDGREMVAQESIEVAIHEVCKY